MQSFKASKIVLGVATASLLLSASPSYSAAVITIDDEKSISLGIGLRAGLTITEDGSPNGDSYGKDFDILNSRVYISGQLNSTWKFTLNTDEIHGEYGILDAQIQYEPSEAFNVWVGRVLTPADRVEMNGPFYGLNWNQYTTPFFASDSSPSGEAGTYGRDDGIVVWGSADKFQYAFGIFDGLEGDTSANQDDNFLFAGRFAYNFLNKEQNPGYYTSSSYYGSLGNIFTVGFSFQSQADGSGTKANPEDFNGYALDFFYEGVVNGGGVINLEAEYKVFDTDATSGFMSFSGDSMYLTAAYLIPVNGAAGKVQPYLRYTANEPDQGADSDLVEVGMNYIIKGHNLRLNANVVDGDASFKGTKGADTTAISFGIQYQL